MVRAAESVVAGLGRRPLPSRTLRNLLRLLSRLIPKIPTKAVLHSVPFLEDGIHSIAVELVRRGYRPVVLTDREEHLPPELHGQVRMVRKRSARAAWHYLSAPYVFSTHGLFGDPPPPSNQCHVNLWHGEPPVKVLGRYEGQSSQPASVAPVLSTVGQAFRCTEFGLHPSRVPVLGAPRNDRLVSEDGAASRRALLGAAADRTCLLWLPTFRAMACGTSSRVDTAQRFPGVPFGRADLDRLDDWLTTAGVTLLVKIHPLDADGFDAAFRSIRVLHQDELERHGLSVYRILGAFDGLITDASSVWIDYLLLDKPIVIAFPDIDDYRRSRGLNLEPYEEWVPGRFVRSVEELIESLGEIAHDQDPTAPDRRRALSRFHQYRDARSTVRVLDHVGAVARAPRRNGHGPARP